MQVKAFLNTTQTSKALWAIARPTTQSSLLLEGPSTSRIGWLILTLSKSPTPSAADVSFMRGSTKAMLKSQLLSRPKCSSFLNKYSTAAIYVTGHSLGGALATLAALDIKATFGKLSEFYSYGEPRVGNAAFATYFASQMPVHRVIHYADIVPHVPPYGLITIPKAVPSTGMQRICKPTRLALPRTVRVPIPSLRLTSTPTTISCQPIYKCLPA
jgi:hypothetical protein